MLLCPYLGVMSGKYKIRFHTLKIVHLNVCMVGYEQKNSRRNGGWTHMDWIEYAKEVISYTENKLRLNYKINIKRKNEQVEGKDDEKIMVRRRDL